MAGENIPIDYLSDHLKDFQLVVTFVSGDGYLGMINFERIEMFRTKKFYPEAVKAFSTVCAYLESHYEELLLEHKKRVENESPLKKIHS